MENLLRYKIMNDLDSLMNSRALMQHLENYCSPGVYTASCSKRDAVSIGQTRRALKARVKL